MLWPSLLLCDPNNLSSIKMSHAFLQKFIRLCIFYKFAIYFSQIIIDQIRRKLKKKLRKDLINALLFEKAT